MCSKQFYFSKCLDSCDRCARLRGILMKGSMNFIYRLMGVVAAGIFIAGQALATPLPEGSSIIGNPSSLLGYDSGLNDYVPGGLSAVNDQNIEFLTDDFALAVDFQSDGLLRLF